MPVSTFISVFGSFCQIFFFGAHYALTNAFFKFKIIELLNHGKKNAYNMELNITLRQCGLRDFYWYSDMALRKFPPGHSEHIHTCLINLNTCNHRTQITVKEQEIVWLFFALLCYVFFTSAINKKYFFAGALKWKRILLMEKTSERRFCQNRLLDCLGNKIFKKFIEI